ncbi:MAG TPA: hypothetical protein VK483_10215 [Chitinophagaceae bacterium]|nr:hypothetical protein [Chitinophagaceae bacterium]
MRMFLLLVVSFLLSVLNNHATAQVKGDSATASGGNFKIGGARAFWMGSNYRKEWNTPITVPVLYISKEHGGLTPVKRGGGKQTKSLRLEDANGREYVIRSVTKYITSKTLPAGLESEAAADLVSDGVSASYPYAALTMSALSQAAGVPHGNPRLVYVADDPKLGEYQKDFANLFAIFEERQPDSVKKIWDTDEVAEKLEKDNDNDVDQLALLRVRILDMFVMDLDRHEGQWSWGAWDNGKGKTYYPIAKDRDQAFYINQGLLPWIASRRALVPQLEGFKPEANNINRFNFAARNLDRFFLNQLSEEDWKREAESFVAKMTDAVIENALAQQPWEIRDISTAKIIQTLKDRRKFIVGDVMAYYYFLADIVSVTGSDKNELFDITHNDDGSILLQVFKITKEGNQSTKMYERKFVAEHTNEIRLYGFDGDDKFVSHGGNDKMKVRLIGGGGQDVFENTGPANRNTMVYDRRDGNNTVTGTFKNKMANDTIVNSFERIYFKYNWQSIFATIGYNPDDGVMIGPTFKYIRHGFRKVPYKNFHQFKGLYAFSTNAVRLTYNNEFIGVFGRNTDITTEIDYKGPNNTSNFFGYGMESKYDKINRGDKKTNKFKYYRIRYDMGDISLQLRHRFSSKVALSVGPTFQFYSYDSTDKFNKIRNVELNDSTLGLNKGIFDKKQSYLGARFDLTVDTRNHPALPSKGIFWNTTFRYLSGNNSKSYDNVSQLNSEFSFYVSLVKNWLTWANRTGVGVTMAKDMNFEFYQAQHLGSNEDLRGYRRERFAGKSKFFNQTELRLKLANLKTYLFPASFGMFAFVDVGRVWAPAPYDKGSMVAGFGGGFWFAPLNKLSINLSVAVSGEDVIPLFGFTWKF